MAEKFDILVYLLLAGAAIGGWRKGFIREVLIFMVWLPTAYAIISILLTYFSPSEGLDETSQQALTYIGWMFFAGWVCVTLCDYIFIKPLLKHDNSKPLFIINKIGGSVFSVGRVFVLVIVGMAMFHLYVRPLDDLAVVERSAVLQAGKGYAEELVNYLRNNNYVSGEVTLYDYAEEQKRAIEEQYEDIAPSRFLKRGH